MPLGLVPRRRFCMGGTLQEFESDGIRISRKRKTIAKIYIWKNIVRNFSY